MDNNSDDLVAKTASLTEAWLSNPNVRANNDEVATFLQTIHATLSSLGTEGGDTVGNGAAAAGTEHAPAVTVRKSLASKTKIISLIDGKPYSTLKRHLSSHGLTPTQYRERYGLKPDYPMVAPAYAAMRSEMAKNIRLGAKGRSAPPAKAPTSLKGAPARKPRRKKLSVGS